MVGDARFGQARDADGPRRPSVVLRRAVPGESLWDLAKSYGTTTEQIRLANQLEDEALPTNRMLLIPGVRCG
jgi:LysM repeat protein